VRQRMRECLLDERMIVDDEYLQQNAKSDVQT
jgi:hypothetical protein